MQKTILRWTIGKVSRDGMRCLIMSFQNLFALYGDRFEYFICYNNIKKNELRWTKKYPITLVCQHDFTSDLKIDPIKENPCWKLYPARLDLDCHEIFIDNDLILYKKIPIIDRFIEKKICYSSLRL